MDLLQIFSPGQEGIASTLVLYSFVIAAGIFIGKLKIFGVSLGVTFVLFVGILMGHLGYVVNSEILKFVREFGLILFIFSIGLQVGPGFFSSFKEGGIRLNMLAMTGIALNVLIVLGIYYFGNINDISALVGVMSGAVTNTPGLAAAQQTITTMTAGAEQANIMASGYAAAYPLGVVGIILAMFVIKGIFGIKVQDEILEIEQDQESAQLKPYIITIEVTNKLVSGHTLLQLHDVIQCNFVVSRIMNKDGKVEIPRSSSQIFTGDRLLIVCSAQDVSRFKAVIGPESDMDWESNPTPVYSRRIVVTKSEYNGVALTKANMVSTVFSMHFGFAGAAFVAISVMLFAFSTCLGWSHYGSKACEFLFGEKITKVYQVIFVLATFGGAVMGENLAWEIADTLNGMMMLPNLIGVLVLSPIVVNITRNYVDRKLKGKDVEPLLSNFPDTQKEAAEAVKRGER